MKLVYIAGPYRGPNTWAIEQNIRRAEEAAAAVWSVGHAALCPHANSRHMDGVTSDDNFLAGTLEMLRRCDFVLVLKAWLESTGARFEVTEAMRLKIPVIQLYPSTGDVGLANLRWRLDSVEPRIFADDYNPFVGNFWKPTMLPSPFGETVHAP